jgi:hypothetical protein
MLKKPSMAFSAGFTKSVVFVNLTNCSDVYYPRNSAGHPWPAKAKQDATGG